MTTQTRRRGTTGVLITAALLLTSGCAPMAGLTAHSEALMTAPATPVAVEAAGVSQIDGAVLRGGVQYDYDVAQSVSEVADRAETVLLGTVVGWSDGRAIQDGDSLSKSAVMEVRVGDPYRLTNPVDTVFVEVQRGGVLVDDAGQVLELDDGERYAEQSVASLVGAVPAGTRVLLLAGTAPTDEQIADGGPQRVVKSWSSPTDAELLSPLPQGLLFEDHDGSHVSGVAEQHDVEFGDWPAHGATGTGSFEQLFQELSIKFDGR